MVKRRKKRAQSPPVAVILSKAEWRAYTNCLQQLVTAVHAANDLVLQLRELLIVKRRQSEAAHRAAATRAHGAAQPGPAAEAEDTLDVGRPLAEQLGTDGREGGAA